MRSRKNTIILSVLMLIVCPGILSAQVNRSEEDEPIKVETLLLNVPVTVNDKYGRSISDLKKDDFVITQGGETQTIEFFAGVDGPMNVAIIIDASGSTTMFLKEIKKAASNFVGLFGRDDKGMIVRFDSKIKILNEFTSDQEILRKSIGKIGSYGGSNMNDALYEVVRNQFPARPGKKAVIVLTDGIVSGGISDRELLNTVIDSDVLVYPVLFLDMPQRKSSILSDEERLKSIASIPQYVPLNDLARASGGRLLAAWLGGFEEAFQNIATELRKQYIIGFHPKKTENGGLGNIVIKVKREGAVVRSKSTIRIKTPSSKEEEKRSPKKKN